MRLYARILSWFFAILALLGAALWIALRPGRASDWLIMQQAEPRLQSIARLLVPELQPLPRDQWDAVLTKYSEAHGMTFTVFDNGGQQLAGEPLTLPPQVHSRVIQRGPPQPGGAGPPPPRSGPPRREDSPRFDEQRRRLPPEEQGGRPFSEQPRRPLEPPPGEVRFGDRFPPGPSGPPPPPAGPPRPDISFPKIMERTENPQTWWFIVRVPLRQPAGPGGAALVLRTESLRAGGLLPDFKPWLWGTAGVLLLASLLWLPFVRGLTRSIACMKQATARIAGGEFNVSVPDKRRDELGQLAAGINAMASRLSGFVTGQKRFLGDIAHELCTPLARMQMAGAALEQRAPEELKARIADLNEEVEAMSQLVSELLDFSRAGLAPQSVALADTTLRPLIEQVLAREAVPGDRVTLKAPPELKAHVHAGLLARAAGNVVRNSLRYAGPQAHLEITARVDGDSILLTIADNGPGVPAEALPNLFDPFYRLESARDRASGGAGLGLAIVRTCIEACRGAVTAHQRSGGGLEIVFRLPSR
jgi:two-component system sensor histidine kinase CpxA